MSDPLSFLLGGLFARLQPLLLPKLLKTSKRQLETSRRQPRQLSKRSKMSCLPSPLPNRLFPCPSLHLPARQTSLVLAEPFVPQPPPLPLPACPTQQPFRSSRKSCLLISSCLLTWSYLPARPRSLALAELFVPRPDLLLAEPRKLRESRRLSCLPQRLLALHPLPLPASQRSRVLGKLVARQLPLPTTLPPRKSRRSCLTRRITDQPFAPRPHPLLAMLSRTLRQRFDLLAARRF